MKNKIAALLAVIALAGCTNDDKPAFDFAQKEVKASLTNGDTIEFKDMKLLRVVKFEDKTSKGMVCGAASNPSQYTGYKGFAIFYKTAFSPVSRELYFSVTDKILPGQDYETLNAICK